jgi:hypothetical protein
MNLHPSAPERENNQRSEFSVEFRCRLFPTAGGGELVEGARNHLNLEFAWAAA